MRLSRLRVILERYARKSSVSVPRPLLDSAARCLRNTTETMGLTDSVLERFGAIIREISGSRSMRRIMRSYLKIGANGAIGRI